MTCSPECDVCSALTCVTVCAYTCTYIHTFEFAFLLWMLLFLVPELWKKLVTVPGYSKLEIE